MHQKGYGSRYVCYLSIATKSAAYQSLYIKNKVS